MHRYIIEMVGDSSKLAAEYDKADKLSGDFEARIKAAGDRLSAAGAELTLKVSAPLAIAGAAALKLAGDAEETQSKFDEVFGEMAADAEAWADKFGGAVGRSRTDLKATSATFGDMLQGMGATREESLKLAAAMTQLGVDIASFSNTADEEAWLSLRSAITGEYEAMKKYGVVLNEATVNQELLNMGVAGGAAEATNAEKAQARLNLITKATANAQGDAERTAGSFSNQMKALTSDLKDVTEELGAELIPLAQDGISLARGGLETFKNLDDGTKKLIVTVAGLAAVTGPTLLVGGKLLTAAAETSAAYKRFHLVLNEKVIPGLKAQIAQMKIAGSTARATALSMGVLAGATAGLAAGVVVANRYVTDAEEKARRLQDAIDALADSSGHSSDELRDMAQRLREGADASQFYAKALESIGTPLASTYVGLGAMTPELNKASRATRDAGADMLDYRANLLDFASVAEVKMREVSSTYESHKSTVDGLRTKYDELKSSIDRALGIDEDIDDQNRTIERASIGKERAERDLADLEDEIAEKEQALRSTTFESTDEREEAERDLSDLKLRHREATLNLADAEDRLQDAHKRSMELAREKSSLEEDLGEEGIKGAQKRLAEIEKSLEDETAKMDAAYNEREDLKKKYDSAMLEYDRTTLEASIENWQKTAEYYKDNPIVRTVGIQVADESGGVEIFVPEAPALNLTMPEFVNPYADSGGNSPPASPTSSSPQILASPAPQQVSVSKKGDVVIEQVVVNSPKSDPATMAHELQRTLRDLGSRGSFI